jgi:RimJ/RimL family protein N-acetyltransferase
MLYDCGCSPAGGLAVRPIRADDKAALADLFDRLSERSRRRRFLIPKPRLSARELAYFTEVDHRRHAALVAIDADGRFVGVARYASAPGESGSAEVAFAVADACQGHGIGSALTRRIVDHARRNGMTVLRATTLAENRPALKLLRRLGFAVRAADAAGIDLELVLDGAGAGHADARAA